MRKTCLFISLVFALSSNAQIGGLLNKAKDKLENKKEKNITGDPAKNSNTTTDKGSESNSQSNNGNDGEFFKKRFEKDNVAEEGFTSDMHKSNVGKIVFSKSHIEKGKEVPAQITNSFSGADLIYARVYLEHSLYNTPVYTQRDGGLTRNNISSFIVDLFVDGKSTTEIPEIYEKTHLGSAYYMDEGNPQAITKNYTCSFFLDMEKGEDINGKTTFELFISTSKDEINKDILSKWAFIANSLSPGEHTIQLKVLPRGGGYETYEAKAPVCIGEFKYTKKPEVFINIGKDYAVTALKPAKVDPKLEAEVKQCLQKGGANVKKVVLAGDWKINRNAQGHIESREIEIYSVLKNKAGYCIEYGAYFTQPYTGSGYGGFDCSENPSVDGVYKVVNGFIDCSTVK